MFFGTVVVSPRKASSEFDADSNCHDEEGRISANVDRGSAAAASTAAVAVDAAELVSFGFRFLYFRLGLTELDDSSELAAFLDPGGLPFFVRSVARSRSQRKYLSWTTLRSRF